MFLALIKQFNHHQASQGFAGVSDPGVEPVSKGKSTKNLKVILHSKNFDKNMNICFFLWNKMGVRDEMTSQTFCFKQFFKNRWIHPQKKSFQTKYIKTY